MSTVQPLIEISATSSSDEWKPVDPEDLPAEWQRYAPLVRASLDAGEGSYSERDVLYALLSGQWQLWQHPGRWRQHVSMMRRNPPDSICITEVIQFPRQRKLLVRYIAGEWEPFESSLSLLEDYAKSQGCQRIEAYMRMGLTRKLPKDWKARHVFMVKELE